MTTTAIDTSALLQSGFEALSRGDARKAREAFEPVVAAGQADATGCVGLAYACRSLGDGAAALEAAEKALALDPSNLRGLLLKADCLAESGDARAAASFYQFALQAAPPQQQLPADLRAELGRAQAMSDRYASEFEGQLRHMLAAKGLDPSGFGRRFEQSLDLLFGKKQVYFQQPTTYFFPELPQIQFYDREAFPWLDAVEAATDAIRAELLSVLRDTAAFTPYVEGDPRRPRKSQEAMEGNPDWSAFYFWKHGKFVPEHAALCPRTMETVQAIPLCTMPSRSPTVLFSQLRPGAHIPSHRGLVNTRLICHLPLIVPPGCSFRVGNDIRVPVEGKAWVFDDTIEHEAWNRSDRTRVILLFEIWRPELSQEERALVSAMFEAIDAYTGREPTWQI